MPPTLPPDDLPHTWQAHIPILLKLAGPIMLSRLAMIALSVTDTIMVGRFAAEELGWFSIGNPLITTMILAGIGLLNGTLVMAANAFGKGHFKECGAVWRHSLLYAFGLGCVCFVICLFGEEILLLTGQSPEMATHGSRIILVLGLGLPFALVHFSTVCFLEAIKKPLFPMYLMVAANVVNIFFNWLFIYGALGMPALGAEGSAWSSSLVRLFLCVILAVYVWRMKDADRYGVKDKPAGLWKDWAVQRRIGYGAGVSMGAETAAFAFLSFWAGWLGALPLASYAIVLNVISVVFMLALGLGSASAVLVGHAVGRDDYQEATVAGWSGLGLTSFFMLLIAPVMVFFPELIAGLYSSDPALINLTVPQIIFAAAVILFDGGQVMMVKVVRGMKDIWSPAFIQIGCYATVMIPLSWYLAHPAGMGVRGLLVALFVTSILALSFLSARFMFLCRCGREMHLPTPEPDVSNLPPEC